MKEEEREIEEGKMERVKLTAQFRIKTRVL